MNEGTIVTRWKPPALPFKGKARPSPVFRPFNFKKNPPRKKKKHGERKRGEGGAPTSGRRWAAFQSHRELQCVQFGIASPRARRVAGHSGLVA